MFLEQRRDTLACVAAANITMQLPRRATPPM